MPLIATLWVIESFKRLFTVVNSKKNKAENNVTN